MRTPNWTPEELTRATQLYKWIASRVTNPNTVTHNAICSTVAAIVGKGNGNAVANAFRNHVEMDAHPPYVPDDDFCLLKTWIISPDAGENPLPTTDEQPSWIYQSTKEILEFVEQKNHELQNANLRLEETVRSEHNRAYELEAQLKEVRKELKAAKAKIKSLKDTEFKRLQELQNQAQTELGFVERMQTKYGIGAGKRNQQ